MQPSFASIAEAPFCDKLYQTINNVKPDEIAADDQNAPAKYYKHVILRHYNIDHDVRDANWFAIYMNPDATRRFNVARNFFNNATVPAEVTILNDVLKTLGWKYGIADSEYIQHDDLVLRIEAARNDIVQRLNIMNRLPADFIITHISIELSRNIGMKLIRSDRGWCIISSGEFIFAPQHVKIASHASNNIPRVITSNQPSSVSFSI